VPTQILDISSSKDILGSSIYPEVYGLFDFPK
jgi:hypothetical protein